MPDSTVPVTTVVWTLAPVTVVAWGGHPSAPVIGTESSVPVTTETDIELEVEA